MTTQGSTPGGSGRRGGPVGASPTAATPRTPAGAIARERLLGRLDQLESVGIIRAATGYGKTVLALQWAQDRRADGWPVAVTARPWTRLDPWAVVRDALTRELRAHGHDVPDAAAPSELGAVIDAAGTPVGLVIDDADELDEPDAVKAVAELLTASTGLRLLLVTATRHPLLRSGAQHPVVTAMDDPPRILTLSARDLGFTTEELRLAAASWGHPLDDNRLMYLVALVGGWAKLAREVLDDTRPDDAMLATAGAYAFTRDVILPSVGDNRLLEIAMLVAATGDPTPESVQTMLDAAHIELPDGDALDLLLRMEGVGAVERNRDGGGPTRWRVPALLGEALRRELERLKPELAEEVNRALARRALAANPPDAVRAVQHAARAHDWTLLETCWLDFGPFVASTGREAEELDTVYATIPDDVAETSTVLTVARASARRGRATPENWGESLVRIMGELGTLALDGGWRCRTTAGRWFGAIAAQVTARARGELQRAMVVVRETELAAARAGAGGETSSRPYWWFLVQSGRSLLLDGDIGGSLEMATRAYELAHPAQAPDVRAAAAAHVALVHAHGGDLLDADRWLVRYVESLDPAWEDVLRDSTPSVAEALLGLNQLDLRAVDVALERLGDRDPSDVSWPLALRVRVRRAALLGDAESGMAMLEQAERTQAVWLDQPGLARTTLLRLRADMLLALGEAHRAADLLETDPAGSWSDAPRTRWHLLTNEPHAALRVAELGVRRPGVSLTDRTVLLALGAWAAHLTGQRALAVRSFRSARRLADPQGSLFVFALLPAAVRDALAHDAQLPFDDEALARLGGRADIHPETVETSPLTPRERTVLTLLAERPTVREVADALTTSVNTVRKQVLSIYTKLGVHDREAALRRAHELGLLRPDDPAR